MASFTIFFHLLRHQNLDLYRTLLPSVKLIFIDIYFRFFILNLTLKDKIFLNFKAKPTSNGLVCQIPFYAANPVNTSHYHCLARNEFDCLTENSNFARCEQGIKLFLKFNLDSKPFETYLNFFAGRFLHSRAPALDGSAYFYNFTFPAIRLSNPGLYAVSYFVFYDCGHEEEQCRQADESIRVTINRLEITHEYDELKNNPPWIRKETQFITADSELNVSY
jgi:hypothetical protein